MTLLLALLVSISGCSDEGDLDNTQPESSRALLSALTLSTGNLDQSFQGLQITYTAKVGFLVTAIQVAARPREEGATLTINGVSVNSGRPSAPIALAVGDTSIFIEVTAPDGEASVEYELIITRETADFFAQQAYIKASNPGADDYFGYSVSVSGNRMAVGAYLEDSASNSVNSGGADNSASASGAVYIFEKSGDSWLEDGYIKAPNSDLNDHFGHSVSLSGHRLAIGAPGESSAGVGINTQGIDNNAPASGAVYLYQRSEDDGWAHKAYIKAPDAEQNDNFGWSVELESTRLIVGAIGEDSAATGANGEWLDDCGSAVPVNCASNSGAVYVYRRDDDVWTYHDYIKPHNTGAGDQFGYSLSLDKAILVVGARYEDSAAVGIDGNGSDNSAADSGAAYVFIDNGSWGQQAYLKASNTGAADWFGSAVSVFDDRVVVGAYGEDSSGTGVGAAQNNNASQNSGAVYVFERVDTVWSQAVYIKAPVSSLDAWFGRSVSLYRDVLVVGVPQESSNATGLGGEQTYDCGSLINCAVNSGAVFVYLYNGRVWKNQYYVKALNADPDDRFGHSVSIEHGTVAIGTVGEASSAVGIDGDETDNSLFQSGAVYTFE